MSRLPFKTPAPLKTSSLADPSTLRSGATLELGLVLKPTTTSSLSSQTTKRYPMTILGNSSLLEKKSLGNPNALRSTRTSAVGSVSLWACVLEQPASRVQKIAIEEMVALGQLIVTSLSMPDSCWADDARPMWRASEKFLVFETCFIGCSRPIYESHLYGAVGGIGGLKHETACSHIAHTIGLRRGHHAEKADLHLRRIS